MIYAYNTTLRRMPIHKKEHWKNAIIFLGNNSLSLLLQKVKEIEHANTFSHYVNLLHKRNCFYLNSYRRLLEDNFRRNSACNHR